MKSLAIFAALSVLANALLGYLYLRAPAGGDARTPPLAAAPAQDAGDRTAGQDPVAAAIRDHPGLLAAVRSDDPREVLSALRQAGFPKHYVDHMIMAVLNDAVNPERLDRLRRLAALPFWKADDSQERAELDAVQDRFTERTTALARELLGGPPPTAPRLLPWQERRYRFLPADKADAVSRINTDYDELLAQAYRGGDPADRTAKLRLLEQERRADLTKVLSPAELELYELHFSRTAVSMRNRLELFDAAEEEFRAIYNVRKPVDDAYGPRIGQLDPAQRARLQADERNVNDGIRAALGEARYAEYVRAQDFGYRAAVEITRHYNLPAANAAAVYDLQNTAQIRMSQAMRAAGSDAEARRAALRALASETISRLAELLGTEGVDAFRTTGGTWLRVLERSAGTAPPRPGG